MQMGFETLGSERSGGLATVSADDYRWPMFLRASQFDFVDGATRYVASWS